MKKITLTILVIWLLAMIITGCADKEKSPLEQDILWTNFNINSVENLPQNPTYINLAKDCKITALTNYHYFNNGNLPGEISLIGQDGKAYGPWKAKGREGQGNVKNAYWDTFPNIELKAGTYEVIDTNVDTWSHNAGSDFSGFTEVRGISK
jgi:hypothetical protein